MFFILHVKVILAQDRVKKETKKENHHLEKAPAYAWRYRKLKHICSAELLSLTCSRRPFACAESPRLRSNNCTRQRKQQTTPTSKMVMNDAVWLDPGSKGSKQQLPVFGLGIFRRDHTVLTGV